MQEFSVHSSVNSNISKQNATNINFVHLAFTLYMNFYITVSISDIKKLFTGLAINLWPGKITILYYSWHLSIWSKSSPKYYRKVQFLPGVFHLLCWVHSQAHLVHTILRADRTVQGRGQSWLALSDIRWTASLWGHGDMFWKPRPCILQLRVHLGFSSFLGSTENCPLHLTFQICMAYSLLSIFLSIYLCPLICI